MTPADALTKAIKVRQETAAQRRQAAIDYRRAGLEPKFIAAQLGISAAQVYRYLREAGVPAGANKFPRGNVRIQRLYRAACQRCRWKGEIHGHSDRHLAEDEKRAHIAEHRRGEVPGRG